MKKIIPLLLALLMIIPLCAACGETNLPEVTTPAAQVSETADPSSETTSNVDAEGYELDDLPELNFNDTINIAHWSDYTMTEFYVEEDNGNGIDSAIFKRNQIVCERLGVELKYASAKGAGGKNDFTNMVKNDYNADKTYDIFASYSRTIPALALEGLCVNLLTTKYVNIEKPWWPKVLTSECTINNRLYFASGDISTNMLWMMIATFYNRQLYENYKSNDLFSATPEQLVKENKWTMERMFSMVKDVYVDATGDGPSADDSFGMALYQTNIDAYQTAAGITSVIKNSDGSISINPDWMGERTQDVVNLVGNFLKTNGVFHKDDTAMRAIFNEERAIFIMDRTFIVAGKDNASDKSKIEFAFGVIPNPKFTADQETFLTNMGHPFTMYGISAVSHNVDAASATLECLASESYRLVTPQVFENTMKVRYADGAEVAEMYDIIRSNVSFDLGRLYASTFGNTTANAFRTCSIGTPSSFLTTITRSKKAFDNAINTLTAAFEK